MRGSLKGTAGFLMSERWRGIERVRLNFFLLESERGGEWRVESENGDEDKKGGKRWRENECFLRRKERVFFFWMKRPSPHSSLESVVLHIVNLVRNKKRYNVHFCQTEEFCFLP